jgi:SAM-dependent methyltransferase
VLTELAQVVRPTEPAVSLDAPNHPMRSVTREAAFDPGTWDGARAREVAARFDELAPGWDERLAGRPLESEAPIDDAFRRGGLGRVGRALEIGSGTGRGTRHLVARVDRLVASDLSMEMLRHAPPALAPRVRADGANLPFPGSCFDLAVCVNALLFPAEVDRVLRPGGALLWVNTLAERTPIHLPPADVVAALPGPWDGLWARAGDGLWAVLRRPEGHTP